MAQIQETCGAILVQYEDESTNDRRRLWFDETADEGRLVLTTVVAAVGDERKYISQRDWYVPPDVAEALDREGYDVDPIYDLNGKPVYTP